MPTPTYSPDRSTFPLAGHALACTLAWSSLAFPADPESPGKNFSLHGYATVNYQKFDWQTDLTRRAQVDLERLALEPAYQPNAWLLFEAEFEIEHGGTGVTMEYDKVEEFGEFESEIEKGGEVVIEELAASILIRPWFNLRLGHFFVPVGMAFVLDEPSNYFTVYRSEAESNLLPVLWHETGAEVFGEAGPLRYRLQLINGLDATGFGSATWVARGHQGRFETVNADNLAVAGRLDFEPWHGVLIGLAGYYGNSADNRPKADLRVPAHVGILDLHGEWRFGPWLARGLFLYGTLENAAAVSTANRNLSNNLNVKRTPVAESARGGFVEAGVDALSLAQSGFGWGGYRQSVVIYGRLDAYDTMREIGGTYFNNPRWDRETWSGGVNYAPHPSFILKSQFARRTLGTPSENREDTYSLGMGLLF